MAGWNFIARLFSRSDCRDGHPEFTARKNLQFVINVSFPHATQSHAHHTPGLLLAQCQNRF